MKNKYFPLFVDLSEKLIVVIGAGKIASRRILTLVPFSENLLVIAPEASEEVKQLAAEGKIRWRQEPYNRNQLADADLVLACTDSPAVNDDIHAACKCLGIPVNVCSDRTRCDFYFPGVIQKDNVVVGVTAGGEDHHLAKTVRENIEQVLKKKV